MGLSLTLKPTVMKEYKVESLVYYTKFTFNKNHILNDSTRDIQAKLDEYAADGWSLAATTTTSYGAAVYFLPLL